MRFGVDETPELYGLEILDCWGVSIPFPISGDTQTGKVVISVRGHRGDIMMYNDELVKAEVQFSPPLHLSPMNPDSHRALRTYLCARGLPYKTYQHHEGMEVFVILEDEVSPPPVPKKAVDTTTLCNQEWRTKSPPLGEPLTIKREEMKAALRKALDWPEEETDAPVVVQHKES